MNGAPEQERRKGKSANPFRSRSRRRGAREAGGRGGVGRQRAVPTEGGRSPGAPTSSIPPTNSASPGAAHLPRRRAPPPELPAPASRPPSGRLTRAPAAGVQRCGAGPRPGEGRRGLPALPAAPSRAPNTDCRRPDPGPAQDRRAGAASSRCKRLEAAVAPRKTRGPVRGGPGREVRLARGTPRPPPIPDLRPARPAGGSGSALPGQAAPPGPRVRRSHHARHTAPALRSAPPSRGAGAGGPKPSWP